MVISRYFLSVHLAFFFFFFLGYLVGLSPTFLQIFYSLYEYATHRSDPYRVLESLTLLLGTSPLHPTPRWLRNVCGRYLSRVLLRPNGVQIVLEYMCGGSGGDLGEGKLEIKSKV